MRRHRIVVGVESPGRQEAWIEVELVRLLSRPGHLHFRVVDDSMTVDGDWLADAVELGFATWDDEVEDLDGGASDEAQSFGISRRLRWRNVELTPRLYAAPSIARLREALSHVTMRAYCPGDI